MHFSTERIDGNTVVLTVLSVLTFWNGLVRIRSERAAKRRAMHLQATADKIHTLTNSSFGAQLRVNVVALKGLEVATRRLALATHSEADEAAHTAAETAFREAERGLYEHLIQQAKVDAAESVSNLSNERKA
jgi:hypothetical protein